MHFLTKLRVASVVAAASLAACHQASSSVMNVVPSGAAADAPTPIDPGRPLSSSQRQWIETTLFVDRTAPDGTVQRTVGTYGTRYIHHFEMLGLLEAACLELEGVYGSYDLEPLDDQSPNLIFVTHAR